MRKKDNARAAQIRQTLTQYERTSRALPGIHDPANRNVFVEQLIDSERRIRYVRALRTLKLSPNRANPASPTFDPLRAAAIHANAGNIDEAAWLAFLAVYFGKHHSSDWLYVQDVCRGVGNASAWTWASASSNPSAFRSWMDQYAVKTKAAGLGGFGNHRKYESLSAAGRAIESYIQWVLQQGGHATMLQNALTMASGDPHLAFDLLFRSIDGTGMRFGRLAKFDYLTMLSKLGLSTITPGSTYLAGATGPRAGAQLLYGGNHSSLDLESWLADLGRVLNTCMQVLEDALCNWQKSPSVYKRFHV